jgi:cytochrome P450
MDQLCELVCFAFQISSIPIECNCLLGPGNLSVNIPEAVQIVLGSESKCTKTPWYEQSLPLVNLHTIRDKKAHERRRKVFSKAFSPQAMRAYEPRVVTLSELLVTQLRKIDGQTFDATRWFKYWAFDVMGELGFGESFHMLEEDTNRWVPDLLENGMAKVGKLTPIPWATPIIRRIPFLSGGPRQFLEFVGGKVKERAAKVTDKPDVRSLCDLILYNFQN